MEGELALFLERFVAAVKSSRINAAAAVGLFYRKLGGSALQVTRDFLEIQDCEDDYEKQLRLMIHCLESRSSFSADPVLPIAWLASIQKNQISFVQLQTKISKLARFAVLNDPKHQQI